MLTFVIHVIKIEIRDRSRIRQLQGSSDALHKTGNTYAATRIQATLTPSLLGAGCNSQTI